MGEPIVEPTEEEEQAFFLENQMVIARLIKSFLCAGGDKDQNCA